MLLDDSSLPAPSGLGPFRARFSTLSDGNMERSLAERVQINLNRERFFESCGLRWQSALRVRPSHSANIELVEPQPGRLRRTTHIRPAVIAADYDFYDMGSDGILTLDRNAAVCLVTGDCIPLLLWDVDSGLHGVLHVGLLGGLNGMTLALEGVLSDLKVLPGGLRAYLGPSISRDNYDVTRSGLWKAIEAQVHAAASLKPILDGYFDGTFFDLRGLVRSQLLAVGLLDEHIECHLPCTAQADSQFFSNYASKHNGRKAGGFCSVIWAP